MDCLFDLEQLATECQVKDRENFIDGCGRLEELLLAANRQTNLTRICRHDDFVNKHVADSLLIAKYFPRLAVETLTLADIGCGAGFPSLILALAFPQLKITAIDSNNKKCAFVRAAAITLGLNNLQVIAGRARELNRRAEMRGKYVIITARAVAEAALIFRESRNMLQSEGQFIFYKTPQQVDSDLPQLEKVTRKYNFTWLTSEIYQLPAGDGRRQFIYSASVAL